METDELMEMVAFLFKRNLTAHIDTIEGTFLNGLITEVHETFLVLDERLLGETPVTFSNIKILERYRGI